MNKAYKFRLYPNKEQEILINKIIGASRFMFNQLLAERISNYEQCKSIEDKEKRELALKELKQSTPAQYKEKYPWLKEVDSLALACSWTNVNTAYKNFFNGGGYPKFKSKHKSKLTYTTYNLKGTISILEDGKYIKLPKLKKVKIKCHRQIGQGELIKSCTISKTPTNKYYISILVEYEKEIEYKEVVSEFQVVGLDFSMKDLYYSSEDKKANYPRYYRESLEKLVIEQRKLSRKKIGSKNRDKQRLKVAKLHEHIANQRKDFLHKKSRELVSEFDAICIEDLNMKAMSQCLNFGKSVHDNGWGMFTVFLGYKLQQEGKQLIKIDKWYPSSKTCSCCGSVKEKLGLEERIYICENCGIELDRDYNASLNIKRVGMTQLAW